MYTVVGYDKDNDVYVAYWTCYEIELAYQTGNILKEMIIDGELRRADNGEPIDWIEIYEGWGTETECRIAVI